ncbi:MAG: aspartate aminotransferase family protein [Anaerolineales bacterium]|jgi:glutamate-1-semialdehyde 2,1-aminomutase|nr:aspartate aminotransferase family protein [Anaerolineales bacterium]
MNIPFEKSKALQKRAKQVMPLGVNSNFRYWGEGITPYVQKGKGCYLWDVDGNRYIDYRMAFGPIILGHAYDAVDAKVHEEIEKGLLFAMTSELEVEVAEMIVAMCPAVEMVRLACSGTEATMHAIRVARAYTGRERIVKFEGMYHGFHDHTLWSTYAPVEAYGNENFPVPIPSGSGIPRPMSQMITTLPFNRFEIFEKTLQSIGYQVAAVIMEPCLGNCAAILPEPGFLELVRQKCDEYGIVMILDEVKTGFRIARGGAQEFYNLKPDLATYAKALGNGYPVAAFGGKKEIMSIIGQGVSQGGTYTNNKPGVAAAYATLKLLRDEPVLETIAARGLRLMQGVKDVFDRAGIPVCINGYPAMFTFAVGAEKVINQRDWNDTEKDYYLRIMDAMIERGVMPDHDPREPWFLCYSHTDEVIDQTLSVLEDAVRTAKR